MRCLRVASAGWRCWGGDSYEQSIYAPDVEGLHGTAFGGVAEVAGSVWGGRWRNALAVHAASESLDPNICARYFINRGDAFSRIKRSLGRWLLQGRDALKNITSVFDELTKNLVRIKPDRSYPRNFTQKPHLSHA